MFKNYLNKFSINNKEKTKYFLIFSIVGLFLILNSIFIANEYFWFPSFIGILLTIYFAFFSSDKLLYLIIFLTPLSVLLKNKDFNFGLSLPAEPFMILLTIVFLFKILYENGFDKKITKHPITLSIFGYLIWIVFTSIISEFPLVSFKYFASRLWFIVPLYFVMIQVFKKNKKNIRNYFWLYSISLSIVVVYTTIMHSQYGFDEEIGHWIMSPFYNDHTAYGAALAFYVPITFGLLFDNEYKRTKKLLIAILFFIILIGLYLSFSRAAWMSVAGAIAIFVIIKFKIKFYYIISILLLFIGLFFIFQNDIMYKMKKNKQDSSKDFVEHIESISNISTDDSNLERINRWAAAIRLFKERPIAGWGPGTYQFVYAPYQYSNEKTLISTNAGDKGTAHSEYIGPLAEIGIVGLIAFLLIIILTIQTAVKIYYKTDNKSTKTIAMVAIVALSTYIIHGFLNNFLDTDKLAVPFWGTIAVIVALDIYHSKNEILNNK